MKQALSARYGGLLIEATEADYSSFKHLHLLCPNCKRSVYLVQPHAVEPHSRKRKDGTTTQVQGYSVDPYFAHHPEVDRSIVDDCELRVSSLSDTQKAAIQAKSRQQLLKRLHAHFWRILKTNFKMFDHDSKLTLIRDLWIRASIREENFSKRLYEVLIGSLAKTFRAKLEQTKLEIDHAIDVWFEQSQEQDLVPEPFRPLLTIWRQKLDRQMQKLIVAEMLDFLCQPRQTPILEELIEAGVYMLVLSRAVSLERAKSVDEVARIANLFHFGADEALERHLLLATRSLIGINEAEYAAAFIFIRDDVVQNLAFTDWAGEFDRLERLEKGKANLK